MHDAKQEMNDEKMAHTLQADEEEAYQWEFNERWEINLHNNIYVELRVCFLLETISLT